MIVFNLMIFNILRPSLKWYFVAIFLHVYKIEEL